MAERRMFAKTIVLSDAFLDMPMSARCLYFTLGMLADDDGFVNAPRSIMRQCGASDDDMKLLIAKKFCLIFDSGVIVIKHWRINNYLQKDRINPTKYVDEKAMLELDEKGGYTMAPAVYTPTVYTQNSVDKDNVSKDSVSKDISSFSEEKTSKKEEISTTDRAARIEHFVELVLFAERYGYDKTGTYNLAATEGITREEIDEARRKKP